MKYVYKKILIIIFLAIIPGNVFAKERAKIAVIEFNAINVPTYFASYVKANIEAILVQRDDFYVVERSQVDIIYQEVQIKRKNKDAGSNLIEAGKLLSADIIITGTVEDIEGDKKVTVKLINVNNGVIISTYTTKFSDFKEIKGITEKAAKITAKNIKRYVKTGKSIESKYEIYTYTNICYILAAGMLRDIFKSGFGFNLGCGVKNMLFYDTMFGLSGGFYTFSGLRQGKYLQFMLDFGYIYNLTNSISVSPIVSGGANIMFYVRDYKYEYRYLYGYVYDLSMKSLKETAFAPLLKFQMNFEYVINSFISVQAGTALNMYFEQSGYVNYFTFNLGTTIVF